MDEYQGQLTIILILAMGVYLTAVLLVGRRLPDVIRRLLVGLTIFEIALILIYQAIQAPVGFWSWLFDPRSELAIVSSFSAGQHLVIALLALLLALRLPGAGAGRRLYWLVLALPFIFLWTDEYWGMHDVSVALFDMTPFMGAAVALLLVIGLFLFKPDRPLFLLMLFGLFLIGLGGVVIDSLANANTFHFGDITIDWLAHTPSILGIPTKHFETLEEFCEMAGGTLILVAALAFARAYLSAPGWRLARRVSIAAAVAWAVFAVAMVWIIPPAEEALVAQAVRIIYPPDGPQITGYRASAAVAAPGDTLGLAVYTRVTQPISDDYHLSVTLLTRPEGESVTHADLQLGEWLYPSSAWIPGLAVRNWLELPLPEDLPTPASYWVVARLWKPRPGSDIAHLSADDLVSLDVVEADRPLITPDSAVLFSLPVVSPASSAAAPPEGPSYAFDGGIALAGAALPEAATLGEPLALEFWWRTADAPNVDADWVQFIHLFHSNGEDYYVADREPFEGHFPTADWPGGLTFHDTFTLTLSGDLPPGEYTVRTGFYEPIDKDRIPVVDESGVPVQDYSIPLGTITMRGGE